MPAPIPTRVIDSVAPAGLTPAQVAREFRALVDGGATLRVGGEARRNPARLLQLGYTPKHKIVLFDTSFYLTNMRQTPEIRFLVSWVVQARGRRIEVHPCIFYKDVSLVWRSASHFVWSNGEIWIGKGDVRQVVEDGEDVLYSDEATTDLPLEVQTAMETLCRAVRNGRPDDRAVALLLRRAPAGRIEPYRDFSEPRRRAAANRRNLVNGGRPVARFTRRHDPSSLRFTPGYEPDFRGGILETSASTSRLYGGALRRFRILSRNRVVQYQFVAGPRHAWIIPPQATTTELSSYGVRTIDVAVDDDLCVPGYEYHFLEDPEDPSSLFTQIPPGFAGPPNPHDETRCDASPWLDRLPVIREFRRAVGRG
jgi:hypothetical protein